VRSSVGEDEAFDDFLEEWFSDFVIRNPMEALRFGKPLKTCRGLSQQRGNRVDQIWGNASAPSEADNIREDERWLQRMQERFNASIGSRTLSDERHVSFTLMRMKVQEMQQEHHFRAFRPPFGPLGCQIGIMGCQVQVAGMLRAFTISDVDDAKCYVALLHGLEDFFLGHGMRLREAADNGVFKYRFVLEAVEKDCNEILPDESSAPEAQSAIARSTDFFKAFQTKLQKIKGLSAADTSALLSEVEGAIQNGVWPAYRSLRGLVRNLLPKGATATHGISELYDKEAHDFYAYRVRLLGVGSDALSLHQNALKLVAENAQVIRNSASAFLNNSYIHKASETLALALSDLQPILTESHYSNDENGRLSYISDAKAHIDTMWKSLRESTNGSGNRLFFLSDIPELPCSVQRISSKGFPGVAQYSPGSIGAVNRSATVAFNVNDMTKISSLELESLCHHEVVPGHHLQVTKTLTLPLPSFRRYLGDEAFAEGWAVYAEQELAPRLVNLSASSNLGRLSMKQFKFVRMAVDTGLHYLQWDRKKAETFYIEQSLMSPQRAKQAVDRHFAWPAQALTYAAGYEEMKKIRHTITSDHALMATLGKDWEAMMHKAILSHGDMPLALLEKVVLAQLKAWSSTA